MYIGIPVVYMELNFVNLSLKSCLSLDWSKKNIKKPSKSSVHKNNRSQDLCTENSSQIKLLEIIKFISPLLYVSNSFIKLYILGTPEDLESFP